MNNYNFDDLIISDYTGNEKNVVIPEGVLRIEAGAFKGNKDIVCVYLPKSLIYLGDEAFSGCNNLVSVTIPDTVEDIEEGAFDDCPNLEEVNIPDGSDIIDQYSLADTKWYRDNKDGFFILGGTLLGYNGKSGDVIVPPSVRRIVDDVLDSLRSCRCISLPSTMTEMPDIPSEGFTDPIVSVYEVDPDRALCRL